MIGGFMKNYTFFFVFLLVALLSFATMAQSPWELQRANGLSNSVNPAVVFSAVDENVCWGINYENSQFIRTLDGGTNWTVSTITGATGLNGSSIFAIDVNTAFAAMTDPSNATSGGVFKTTDGGLTWTKQITAFPGSGGHPADIHFFDADNGVVIGNPHNANWEIYTTTNGGVQWNLVSSVPAMNGEFTGDSHYSSAGNNIWFGTVGGSANNFAIYRSTNRGTTWQRFPQPANITLCVAFKDSLNGLASNPFENGNKISRTTDGGVTWTPIQNVPTAHSTSLIAYAKGSVGSYVITSHRNIGYPVATIPGSSYSNDDGSTWNFVNNLPHNRAEFSSWNIGWSGGVNDSVYKWIGLPTDVKKNPVTVNNFSLSQNYPNPFNPSTTINFSVPSSEFVTLKIYDVLGNEVATLLNEEKPAGTYQVSFNASGLSSGVYFYTLTSGNFMATKKLILLR
jgi:photosystem II stability/assembly factor-like uncharacterized protein